MMNSAPHQWSSSSSSCNVAHYITSISICACTWGPYQCAPVHEVYIIDIHDGIISILHAKIAMFHAASTSCISRPLPRVYHALDITPVYQETARGGTEGTCIYTSPWYHASMSRDITPLYHMISRLYITWYHASISLDITPLSRVYHALDITPVYHDPSTWGPLYECPHTFMHSYLHTHTHTHTRATRKCINTRTPHTHALVGWQVLMRIRIPISMCVYACGCNMCVCVYECLRLCVCTYACIYVCMCVNVYACTHAYMHVNVCAYMYI